ncbi:uncharacterized protein [Blastocystis hominis]|uniref:ABC transporter domain-containing protein n=1 Tax=Blastocystis hominis TaxID=12968 RepID=D8MB59_BLAHO|nr:uncharacterized protein [Blastocystis hominis]CBK25298.2 unnamed protein product [Blastocystis hominis]|eukprot:XP_012899346.1 uncharacterized protein [Blastocystis hominis]
MFHDETSKGSEVGIREIIWSQAFDFSHFYFQFDFQIDKLYEPILEVENLHVTIAGKEVLKGINLTINEGETHILFGPNGSGKSTLIKTIMGLSDCIVTEGSIRFLGQDITNTSISDRSTMGIGMLFQSPPEIEGLPVNRLVSTAFSDNSEECSFFVEFSPLDIQKVSEITTMSNLVSRDLNVGFSGGERKRCEAFQLLLQKPLLSMLDEPESGVDLESVRVLGKALSSLQNQPINGRRSATIIITHTGSILEFMHGTIAHVVMEGRIACTGNEYVFFRIIQSEGFE